MSLGINTNIIVIEFEVPRKLVWRLNEFKWNIQLWETRPQDVFILPSRADTALFRTPAISDLPVQATGPEVRVRVRVRVSLQLTVRQSVRLGVEPDLGLLTRDNLFLFFFLESYCLVIWGRPLWREVGSVICQSLSLQSTVVIQYLHKLYTICVTHKSHVLIVVKH
jgi:hypothetical protein